MQKSEKIQQLYKQGYNPTQIAAKVKTSRPYVYRTIKQFKEVSGVVGAINAASTVKKRKQYAKQATDSTAANDVALVIDAVALKLGRELIAGFVAKSFRNGAVNHTRR